MSCTILLSRSTSVVRNNLIAVKSISRKHFLKPVRCFSATHSRNMKLLQFTYKDKPEELRAGVLHPNGDEVIDLNKADPSLPVTLIEILKCGELDKVKQLLPKIPKEGQKPQPCKCTLPKVPLSTVNLKAPIHNVDKILCIGLNYADHCTEQNLTPPAVPMVFSKFNSCIIGPSDAIKIRTDVTAKVDWEVELVVVIGKKASFVKAANAYDYVLGYTVAQDVSARDWQKEKNMGQFLLGKAMDTFCPIGPWIVTKDEIKNPQNLDITCTINGEVKQTSNTKQLIHKIPDLIERISSVMTLLPGDLILSGTPGGVGMYRSPPEYLKPGDVIRSEVQKIGAFEIKCDKFC